MKSQSEDNKTFFWTAKSRKRVKIDLKKPGQKMRIFGIFLAKDRENFTIELEVNHMAPRTESTITVRGMIVGNAAGNFHGNVFIKKGAKGARAALEEKSLLLGDQARSEVIPALEIDEDDVQATHSTYIGQLDEDEIFYLRSRGISEKQAQSMLIQAFFSPIFRNGSRSDFGQLRKLLRSDLIQ